MPVMMCKPEAICTEAIAIDDDTDIAIDKIAIPVTIIPSGFAHFLCLNAYSNGAAGVHSVLCW